ncbi:MAG: hypothetical protein Q9187_003308 [Circinaria calcarea]
MPPLWRLQMRTSKKIAISGLFGLGLLVVAVMGWRIQITVASLTKADFVYGLGNIGVASHLELWLGIIIACLPTLVPLFSKYLKPFASKIRGVPKKPTVRRQLKEARHTIGSSGSRPFKKKQFSALGTGSLLELEEGKNFSIARTTNGLPPTSEENESWISDQHVITVQHDVQVYSEAQKQ